MGWTSPALPFLTKCNGHNDSVNFNPNLNNCTLINPFTEEEGSWMGSLFAIGKIGILKAQLVIQLVYRPHFGT